MNSFFGWNTVDHLRQKGQKLLAKGKGEQAYEVFRKVVQMDISLENLYNLALALMSMNKYDEAEKYLSGIYKQMPSNEMGLLALAECRMMLKKWRQAEKLFTELTKAHPRQESYRNYLNLSQDVVERENYIKSKELLSAATCELNKKNDRKALEILLEAEEYFPQNAILANNIGSVYLLLKQYDKAFEYFTKALSLDPDNLKIRKNVLFCRRKRKR